jgi:hypothetical protein
VNALDADRVQHADEARPSVQARFLLVFEKVVVNDRGGIMSPLPAIALAVTVAVALAPTAASADEFRGSGSVHPLAPGVCERLAAPSPLVREDCTDTQETFTGMLRSTEAATAAQRSWFSRSNRAWISGTERFVGCIGTRCGALTFRFRGGFVADLATSTLRGGRTLVVTGGSGGLAGARGTIVQRFGENAGYVATVRLRG